MRQLQLSNATRERDGARLGWGCGTKLWRERDVMGQHVKVEADGWGTDRIRLRLGRTEGR